MGWMWDPVASKHEFSRIWVLFAVEVSGQADRRVVALSLPPAFMCGPGRGFSVLTGAAIPHVVALNWPNQAGESATFLLWRGGPHHAWFAFDETSTQIAYVKGGQSYRVAISNTRNPPAQYYYQFYIL